jgi:serine/threonine protein kinase
MVKTVGKYDLYGTLGEGAFGKVKYAVNTETNEAVAIKILDKDKIQSRNMGAQIKKEISIMKMINHHHVVSVKDVFATSAKIFIVLEFVGGGELFDKIANEGKLPEEKARFYFKQLVEGLEHCHSNGICHRDLKPENLLLDTDGNLKISDFGFSTLNIGDADGDGGQRAELLHTTCGTPNYVAPEVLGKDGYDGKKADVWSIGVILYVLLAGYLPFDENTMAALFSKIKSADYEFPDWFSPEARDLIATILVPDPHKRPRIAELRSHPWMRHADSGPTPMAPTNHAMAHGAPAGVNPVNNYAAANGHAGSGGNSPAVPPAAAAAVSTAAHPPTPPVAAASNGHAQPAAAQPVKPAPVQVTTAAVPQPSTPQAPVKSPVDLQSPRPAAPGAAVTNGFSEAKSKAEATKPAAATAPVAQAGGGGGCCVIN